MFRIPIPENDDSAVGHDSIGPLDDGWLVSDGRGRLGVVFGSQNYATFAPEMVQAKGRCS